jgi:hypothetical protein
MEFCSITHLETRQFYVQGYRNCPKYFHIQYFMMYGTP